MTNEWFENRMNEMVNLKKDWVSGARVIHPKALEFVTNLFEDPMMKLNIEHWDVGPFINGSIILEYYNGDRRACINVAALGVSAFVEDKDLFKTLTLHFDKDYVMGELLSFIRNYLV